MSVHNERESVAVMRLYVYRWNRMDRKGEICRVLVRGKRNSCLIEFLRDGYKAVTSRNALMKLTPTES